MKISKADRFIIIVFHFFQMPIEDIVDVLKTIKRNEAKTKLLNGQEGFCFESYKNHFSRKGFLYAYLINAKKHKLIMFFWPAIVPISIWFILFPLQR
jgi:hypothetical protein